MSLGTLFRSLVVTGVAVGALVLGSCGGGSEPAAATGPKKLRLAFVTNNSSDFWAIAKAGVMKAASEDPTLQAEFRIPQLPNPEKQQAVVNDLLTKGLDGIAISPIDPANQTEFLNTVASKALLITQDSDAPTSNRACYIGTDNMAAGKQAGEILKKVLPDGGKVAVFVGSLDAQNAQDRLNGIKEVIKDTKIQIVETRTDNADLNKALANCQEVLVKTPDLACMVGLYSYNGPAIRQAVKEGNKAGKVKVVTFDDDPVTLEGIKEGTIDATIVQQPFTFGYESMVRMAKYIRGDKSALPANKQLIVPTLAITKSEVDAFIADRNKLLGK